MDVYVLAPNFERLDILDDFESLVWTERFQAHGDFVLDIRESTWIRGDLKFAKYLETSRSRKPMMIERIEKPQQPMGAAKIQLRGRGLTSFFRLRNTKNQANKDAEVVSGKASNIMRYMVHRYCVDSSTAGSVNVLPGLVADDTDIGSWYRLALERGNLYEIIQSIAYTSGLGFHILRDPSDDLLHFQATQGIDRTVPGSLYREFSTDGESLMNPGSFESIEGYKNHARVLGKKTGVDVYLPGVSPTISGWNRRTLVVEAEDIGTAADYEPGEDDPPATTILEDQEDLKERGLAELRAQANRYQRLVNGDVPTANWVDTSYGLGDIVWVKDNYGAKSKMRISEQIWSLDATGVVRTPTFEEYID